MRPAGAGAAVPAPPPPFSVRPVRPAEHPAVAELTVEVYARAMGSTLSPEYRRKLADVEHRVQSTLVLVAVETQGGVLGSVTYVPGPGPYAEFEATDEAGIRMLAVADRARRRGVGTALVEACVAEARRAGKARVSLHTTSEMTAAQRLYERLGFARDPERDWVPETGVSLLGYVLTLG